MLSIKECRKLLKNDNLSDDEVEEINNSLYQLADVLIESYLNSHHNDHKEALKNEDNHLLSSIH